VLGEGNEPLRLVDRDSGHDVRLRLVDAETGDAVEPSRLVHVPGPGFGSAAASTPEVHRS
jgi:hypothetical protein